MEKVRVWAAQTVIPTYPVGKPEKNPMFLEHRVYQGASGRVYPHTVIDTVSDEKIDKTYNALYLENEYLLVMVLPELGGRVQRALDKTNGYDFVYYNEVIKPAMVGLTGPWISGGIEFNWPQHHRPSTFDPVSWKTEEHKDGSASIIIAETETMYRTRAVTRMTLHPGKAYLEITTQLFNRTEQPQTFLWWANPAVSVNDDTRSIFPPDVYAVMDHGKRDVSAFPIARGVYYKMDYSAGVDISRYKNVPVPTSYMAAHSEFDFLGNYDDGKQAGLLHVADHHISPGKKQWTWGNGEFGQAWDRNLTDRNGPYIELMTGCFTDNQPDFSWLMPQEEKRFTQVFMPYKGVGQVSNATKDAVIGMERTGDGAVVRVYATSVWENARLTVTANGETLAQKTLTLSPAAHEEITVPAPDALLKAELRDASGRTLVTASELAREEQPLPEPATAIPPAKAVGTMDELYLFGTHLEQYHHATWDAADYYREGLRRDPNDVRMNDAYARLLMKRGLVRESVPYLQKAVSAATVKNPNPFDGMCLYNLGAALDAVGDTDGAYEAFFKAAWNGAWQDAAYYRVACIDLRRGEWEKGEEHLRECLRHGPENLLARNALAALLRHQGRNGEAAFLAEETLRIDPLDAIARRELLLSQDGNEDGWTEGQTDDPNPFIELSIEYARAGFTQDAADVLKTALERSDYPLLHWYLAYYTGDVSHAARAEEAEPLGCFPHRLEDCRVLCRCIARQKNAPMAHNALGCYWYDKRQYERAIAHWEKAVEQAPDQPTAHRNLALAYYNKAHRPEDARRLLERAFALDEGDARVLLELDQLLHKLHTPAAERMALLEKYPELVERRDDLKLSFATLLNQLGRYREAQTYIEARHFHPWEGGEGKVPAQWRISLIMQARALIQDGAYEAALPLLERVDGPYPHNLGEGRLPAAIGQDALYWLGVCHAALGHADTARAYWEKGTQGGREPAGMLYYNDQPPENIFYIGLCLQKLGRNEEAEQVFDRLCDYADRHMEDQVTTEYFAVSLPDLAIFDEDLNLRNRAHCLLMKALGRIGKGQKDGAEALLRQLFALYPGHQSGVIHGKMLL